MCGGGGGGPDPLTISSQLSSIPKHARYLPRGGARVGAVFGSEILISFIESISKNRSVGVGLNSRNTFFPMKCFPAVLAASLTISSQLSSIPKHARYLPRGGARVGAVFGSEILISFIESISKNRSVGVGLNSRNTFFPMKCFPAVLAASQPCSGSKT